jgi:hypothetical protein
MKKNKINDQLLNHCLILRNKIIYAPSVLRKQF